MDENGNVYATGSFVGSYDFDPDPEAVVALESRDTVDFFVAKFDANGDLAWAHAIGGIGYDDGIAIAVDPAGNVFVTGRFADTVDFDPGPGVFELTSPEGTNLFVTRFDAGGTLVWAQRIPQVSDGLGGSIVPDPSGNLYVAAALQTFEEPQGWGVFKLDPDGAQIWSRQVFTLFLDLDDAGNVYTTGHHHVGAAQGVTVKKLNAAGTTLWTRQVIGSEYMYVDSIAVDHDGGVLMSGSFSGTVDFDPSGSTYELTSTWNVPYVWKLSSNGSFMWVRQLDTNSFSRKLAVDRGNNVYVAGRFAGTCAQPGSLSILLKLDAGGQCRSAVPVPAYGDAVGVNGAGEIAVAGRFSGTVDFDPGPASFTLVSSAFTMFLTKLDQAPTLGFTDPSTLSWAALFGEATYNVYRSDGGFPGTFLCIASGSQVALATDDDVPAEGAPFAYLVTTMTADGLEGSLGFQGVNGARGEERLNASPCP